MDARGRRSYAPVVLRPKQLGLHRVAIVLPTYTWQAYNFRDRDGDGYGDTWYAGFAPGATLGRAYLGRGLPPFFRAYDLSFLLWLARSEHTGGGRDVEFLGDADLDRMSFDALSRSYDLLVFPGHHEYVTRHEYLLVRTFRDRGGNLIFLSANNFFCRVDRRGTTLRRIKPWREFGRPESQLLGVQYLASDRGQRRGAFVVRAGGPGWLLSGTALRRGSRFGRFGIEIDHTTAHSPPGTRVIAEIPNLLGRGRTAQMTYYETPRGAKVFSAGAFTLAGYARYMPVSRLLENLWARLAAP